MLDKIYSSITEYLGTSEDNVLQNKQLINIANKLSSLYSNKSLKVPQLVVCGTQSSGKSSCINSIIQMDILPTGKNMVTRTPIKLELIHNINEVGVSVQIGNYENSMFKKYNEYMLKEITTEDESIIRENIETFTKKYAGMDKGISYKEIVIKISSSSIPNLTLIDLPGLVMVACTDQGQPEDIKEQIRNLIKHYVEQENTIIMGILPARCDLEVDSALELIKHYDTNGERTIGILTKVDLMNENTDISNYLKNEISNDLKLKYGYFAIKNKNNDSISYVENIKLEQEYFYSHPIYSKMEKGRLGVTNLSIELSNILLGLIKDLIPNIQSDLVEKLMYINEELNKLGSAIIVDENNKNFIMNLYISTFVQAYRESLENYSNSLNYGRQIKDIFVRYRTDLESVDPLEDVNNAKLNSIIEDSEGNHMYFQTSTIQILEKCLIDNEIRSIHNLKNPSLTCVEYVYNLLVDILNTILKLDNFSKYPKLKNYILQKSIELIHKYKDIVVDKIEELINTEESYIWTECPEFRNKFDEINNISNCNFENMRKIIDLYYKTVINTFQNQVPKIVMLNMIKKVELELSYYLTNYIIKMDIIELLQEDDTINKKRKKLMSEKKTIEDIKELINSIN